VSGGRQRERERERERGARQVDREETQTFFPRFFIVEHHCAFSCFFARIRDTDSPRRGRRWLEKGGKNQTTRRASLLRLSSSRCNTCASAFYRRCRAIIIRSAYLSDDHFPGGYLAE
jgi:hypothetical protein